MLEERKKLFPRPYLAHATWYTASLQHGKGASLPTFNLMSNSKCFSARLPTVQVRLYQCCLWSLTVLMCDFVVLGFVGFGFVGWLGFGFFGGEGFFFFK